MKSIIIEANRDGSYNIPVSKDKQKHYKWMAPHPLMSMIRKETSRKPLPLIGYK